VDTSKKTSFANMLTSWTYAILKDPRTQQTSHPFFYMTVSQLDLLKMKSYKSSLNISEFRLMFRIAT